MGSITRVAVGALALGLLSLPVAAQNYATEGMANASLAAIPTAGLQAEPGSFELLSAGDRKIALALFDAQGRAVGNDVAWTLDEIAAAKRSGTSWSALFRQLRAEGLVDAPNLGAVISGAVRSWNAPAEIGAQGNRAPIARRGAFKTLSEGDRKIGEALFETQTIGKKGHQAWSLDQIGTLRQNGARWTDVLERMRADGLTRAHTIDQAVRRQARFATSAAPTGPARKVVVTNGKGRQVVLTTRERRWPH